MSDLSELRERLRVDVERVIGAAAIVELDAEAMRAAILDTLRIYGAAVGAQLESPGSGMDAQAMASAATRMADRLHELQRVRISAVQL